MTIQVSEVINLIIVLAGLPLVVLTSRRLQTGWGRALIVGGYAAIACAEVLTVAEGVGGVLGEWLNLTEHLSYLVAALCYVVLMWGAGVYVRRRYKADR